MRHPNKSVANLVTQAPNSKAIWDLLQRTYGIASRDHKIQIKTKLRNTKKSNMPVFDYKNIMKVSANLLASLQAPVSQEDLTHYIVKGLDKSYQSMIDGVNNRDSAISFEELHEKLILKEIEIQSKATNEGGPAMALNAQSKSSKNKNKA